MPHRKRSVLLAANLSRGDKRRLGLHPHLALVTSPSPLESGRRCLELRQTPSPQLTSPQALLLSSVRKRCLQPIFPQSESQDHGRPLGQSSAFPSHLSRIRPKR